MKHIRISILLVMVILLIGCSGSEVGEIEAKMSGLEVKINDMEAEIVSLKTELDETKNMEEMLKELQEENKKLNDQIQTLAIELNLLTIDIEDERDYEDLTVLTEKEKQIYDDFKKDYDTKHLIGLDPVSVMKLYTYANMKADYDTVYELYTKKEEYVLMTKEEHDDLSQNIRAGDFDKFKDVYHLKIRLESSNEEYVTILWKSKNGYVGEDYGAFVYGFSLIKDEDVWKVVFLPMQ